MHNFKTSALIAALALSCGVAFAQTSDAQGQAQSGTTGASSSDTMPAKTRHAAHKVKHHAKHAAHKAKSVAMHESRDNMRSMGASGYAMNGDRQARMDSAYNDWNSSKK